MDKCTFSYNLNQAIMGRIGMFECNSKSFHGEIVLHVRDSYNYCPFCGKLIKLKEEKG